MAPKSASEVTEPTGLAPALVEAWVALAELVLDTETRTGIPWAALRCLEAGLTPSAALETWYEAVFPVVGHNLLQIAGEWAAWDRDWIVVEVQRMRAGGASVWLQRATLTAATGTAAQQLGAALGGCFDAFAEAPVPAQAQLAADLSDLAGIALDFCARAIAPADAARLLAVHDAWFWRIYGGCVSPHERAAGIRRLAAAFDAAQTSCPSGSEGAE